MNLGPNYAYTLYMKSYLSIQILMNSHDHFIYLYHDINDIVHQFIYEIGGTTVPGFLMSARLSQRVKSGQQPRAPLAQHD